MSKVNPRSLEEKAKMKYLDLLWTSIAQLETREEVKRFFKDLLSESEAIMLSRRIEIARRLIEDESYQSIANNLKVGTDTIGRVQRWLSSGFGGYEKAIAGFNSELSRRFEKNPKIAKKDMYSFESLKQKYPFHFLLFNLFSGKKRSIK